MNSNTNKRFKHVHKKGTYVYKNRPFQKKGKRQYNKYRGNIDTDEYIDESVRILTLGAGQEVGRSCVVVKYKGINIMLGKYLIFNNEYFCICKNKIFLV